MSTIFSSPAEHLAVRRPRAIGFTHERIRQRAHLLALSMMTPVLRGALRVGISANVVTGASLVLGVVSAGIALSGSFGIASIVLTVACLGDALDGALARESQKASVAGAIFDATVDRYGELLYMSAIALYFRADEVSLAIVLAAISGSFMVSYGSAKAEAYRVPVPPSVMRRGERAVCLVIGSAIDPAWTAYANHFSSIPMHHAPLFASLLAIGVLGNISAVRRLLLIARFSARRPQP